MQTVEWLWLIPPRSGDRRLEERKVRLPRAERREKVMSAKAKGLSNRSIARELGVDEGTVRRDLDYLSTPVADRPPERRVGRKERSLQSKPAQRQPVRGKSVTRTTPRYREGDLQSLTRQKRKILTALVAWYRDCRLAPRDAEEIVHDAGKALWDYRETLPSLPIPHEAPAEVILAAKPKAPLVDGLQHVAYHGSWLARALLLNLPDQEDARDEVLIELVKIARGN